MYDFSLPNQFDNPTKRNVIAKRAGNNDCCEDVSYACVVVLTFSRAEVMQKSSSCSFMYGDLTNTDVIKLIDVAFERQEQEQVELLLYKKTRE